MTEAQSLAGVITVPFHIGDFLSGTLHMDTLEKGAYIMLLCAHYQAGSCGLPDDDKKLARICGVTQKVWQRIRPTLQEEFYIKDNFWEHKKVIDVLQKVHEKSGKQRAKALKKHNPDDATAEPRQCQPKPKPKPVKKVNTNVLSKESESDFDAWWSEYPHKVGKADAKKKFAIALQSASVGELIEGVRRYIREKPPDRKWCNPATWLHQQRWLDQPAKTQGEGSNGTYIGHNQRHESKTDRAKAALARSLETFGEGAERDGQADACQPDLSMF